MSIIRSQDQIEDILVTSSQLSLSQRLALGVEHYLAGTDPHRHHKARQEIPFLVQFLPVIVRYGGSISQIGAVNPGVPLGGLAEYSKSAIYDFIPEAYRIRTVDILDETVPSIADVQTLVQDFQRPLMLKADRGERGAGIYFLEDEDALCRHRASLEDGEIDRHPSSIQEYLNADQEYCLQFYHYIDESGTEIREFGGLTLRDIPVVIGDGNNTVHDLINQLPIETQHKHSIIKKMRTTELAALQKIPEKGVKVTVVRTASLDYGTVYRTVDLSSNQKKAIINLLKDLLEHIDTDMICVGRFDLKANSLDDLLAGHCSVIELNAGGGIPTHVYDERLSISEKYDILRDHFDRMMHIAGLNQQKGASPSSLGSILTASWRSLRKKGLSGTDPSSKRIRKILMHITRLLSRIRWQRKSNQFIGIFK